MKKILSVIIAILMIVTTVPIASTAFSFHIVTLKFCVYEQNEDNEVYTGPGFDTDGMGVTIYYINYEGEEEYSVYSITGKETKDEYGNSYADVPCDGIPTRIDYYSEGTAVGGDANGWLLLSVSMNEVDLWKGSLGAYAIGPASYCATIDLNNGNINITDEGVLGYWFAHETKSYKTPEPYLTYANIRCEKITTGLDWTIESQSFKQCMRLYLANQYGATATRYQLEQSFRSGLVTVICHCSGSSEGIELTQSTSAQPFVDYRVDSDTISATLSWSYYNFLDFYIKINPEALGKEWDEQRLSFSVKFDSLITGEEVEIDVENYITLYNPYRTFTLDAAGGSFTDGEETTAITDVTKRAYNKTGDFPVPERQGYTFNGFYLAQDDNSDDNTVPGSEKLTSDTVMADDTTWYASWSRNTYGATYSYLNESGKREYAEYLYKYGEEYSAPEIPAIVDYGDTRFTFTGWSPEFTGTQIMSDENVFYKAQYETSTVYADYTELEPAMSRADEIMSDDEYTERYTAESRLALEAAVNSVEYDLLKSDQTQVDEYTHSLNAALDAMIINQFNVCFTDEKGNDILSVEVDYGSRVDIPDIPLAYVCDEAEHYTFTGWDKSTDGCAYVTEDMQFTAAYEKQAHSFTNYIVDAVASSSGNKILVAQCDMGCGATDTITIISSANDHVDEDGDGFCDNDGEPIEPDTPDEPADEPTDGTCDHLCHKDGFMGFIWKIVRFFLKLFKAQPLCECGAAHY